MNAASSTCSSHKDSVGEKFRLQHVPRNNPLIKLCAAQVRSTKHLILKGGHSSKFKQPHLSEAFLHTIIFSSKV